MSTVEDTHRIVRTSFLWVLVDNPISMGRISDELVLLPTSLLAAVNQLKDSVR